MEIVQKFIQNNNLQYFEDIEALLECASIVRELISEKLYEQINIIINYTIENNYSEAFLWTIGIIQEELTKTDCVLEDFNCSVGGRISNFDEFVNNLQVDFNSLKNYIEKVYDKNGEVEAFFNVMIYKTAFENVFLISSENFDNKDNDYIQYKLSFVKDSSIYLNS